MSEPEAGDVAVVDAEREPERRRRKQRSWARRRHLGLLTVGIALVVLVVGVLAVVLTWDSGRTPLSDQVPALGSGAASLPATSAPATSSPTAPIAVPVTVTGVITAIGDNTMTVEVASTGLSYKVVATATTQYKRYRGFETFQVDMPVVVRGSLSVGVLTATSITRAV